MSAISIRSLILTHAETYEAKIPTCLPNGEYLLRIQSLAIHNPWPAGIPQFYISCAQINVTGSSASAFSPTLSIPGAFKETDPGYTANSTCALFECRAYFADKISQSTMASLLTKSPEAVW